MAESSRIHESGGNMIIASGTFTGSTTPVRTIPATEGARGRFSDCQRLSQVAGESLQAQARSVPRARRAVRVCECVRDAGSSSVRVPSETSSNWAEATAGLMRASSARTTAESSCHVLWTFWLFSRNCSVLRIRVFYLTQPRFLFLICV